MTIFSVVILISFMDESSDYLAEFSSVKANEKDLKLLQKSYFFNFFPAKPKLIYEKIDFLHTKHPTHFHLKETLLNSS